MGVTAMNENGLDMTPPEHKLLYESALGDGKNMSYLKWINDMRGQMAPFRENLCSELFQMLDKRGDKIIRVKDLERRYNPDASKDVKEGKKNADELWDDMADRLDLFGRLGGYDFKSGDMSYDEYMEFWDNVASLVKEDTD